MYIRTGYLLSDVLRACHDLLPVCRCAVWLHFERVCLCVSVCLCVCVSPPGLPAWIFTAVGLTQMSQWALQKHRGYVKSDPAYKKLGRKAIIPFVL